MNEHIKKSSPYISILYLPRDTIKYIQDKKPSIHLEFAIIFYSIISVFSAVSLEVIINLHLKIIIPFCVTFYLTMYYAFPALLHWLANLFKGQPSLEYIRVSVVLSFAPVLIVKFFTLLSAFSIMPIGVALLLSPVYKVLYLVHVFSLSDALTQATSLHIWKTFAILLVSGFIVFLILFIGVKIIF